MREIWARRIDCKRCTRNLSGVSWNILYLYWTGSSMDVNNCQNSSNCIATICAFYCMQKNNKNIHKFQKNIYFCFIDYAKAFDCVDHNKFWKILKEIGMPDYLTCLLRNLYVCRSGSNNYNWTRNSRLVPNRKRSPSRLYIVTLLI